MSLVGSTFFQPSSQDPGITGAAGYTWYQTDTAQYYMRNNSNTAWVLIGNGDQANFGLLSLSGGIMTGAITGSHGLMPLSGGDFSATPTISGNAIATVPYVDSQIAAVNFNISTQINQAIASIPGLAVGSKVAAGAGVSAQIGLYGTFTIPLPVYSDGTTASTAEVSGRYAAWGASFCGADGVVNFANTVWSVLETGAGTRTFQIVSTNSQSGVNVSGTGMIIGYYIMGIRA